MLFFKGSANSDGKLALAARMIIENNIR